MLSSMSFPPSSNRKSTHTSLSYLISPPHPYFYNSLPLTFLSLSNPILTYRVEKILCHLCVCLKCSMHHWPAIALPAWSSFYGKTENPSMYFTAKTWLEGIFISCCNKLLPPRWFNTTDIYSLTFLEAKTMKSRCQQGGALCSSRRTSPGLRVASSGCGTLSFPGCGSATPTCASVATWPSFMSPPGLQISLFLQGHQSLDCLWKTV